MTGTAATPTIPEQANRCAEALRRYDTDDTERWCLIDLLADARHWCDLHGHSFAELDLIAYEHYLTERLDSQGEQPSSTLDPWRSAVGAAPEFLALLAALVYVRSALKLRHLDEASDEDVEDALTMADAAITAARAIGLPSSTPR